MIKKILAAVLALSVFSASSSTLPAEAKLESFKNVEQLAKELSDKYAEKGLKDLKQELAESGVDVKALEESALELNLDPTLTEAEVAETIVDFTRSQLEVGAAYRENRVYEVSKWGAIMFFGLSVIARYSESIPMVHSEWFLSAGVFLALISFVCEEEGCVDEF